jgi:PleD family two-component response regulator
MPDARVDSEEKLLKCADFALYRAKGLGRNRTITVEARDLEDAEG